MPEDSGRSSEMNKWLILMTSIALMAIPKVALSAGAFTLECIGNATQGFCGCTYRGGNCFPTVCTAATCPSRPNTTKVSGCTQSRSSSCGSPPECAGTCGCTISGGVCTYTCTSGWYDCDGTTSNGCECSYPKWYNYGSNVTNNTNITGGTPIKIYANWSQVGGTMSHYLISNMTNNSGTWYNSSWYSFSGAWTNFSVTYPDTAIEGNISFKIFANGTSNLFNVTPIVIFYNHTPSAATYPYWTVGSNSTNSTLRNTSISHNLQWNDSTDLSGYIFSFSNETEYIYQEDANETACSENWNVTYPCSNIYDGNWNTFGVSLSSSSIEINYSKPSNAIGLIWQIKDGISTLNLTIPSICYNAVSDKIRLFITSIAFPIRQDIFSCWDGSVAQTLLGRLNAEIYEEAMWWAIPVWHNDSFTSFSGLTNWSNATHTFTEPVGTQIFWKIYANNSNNLWNVSDIFSYALTENILKAKCDYFCYPFDAVDANPLLEHYIKDSSILFNQDGKFLVYNLENDYVDDDCLIYWYDQFRKEENLCVNINSKKAIYLKEVDDENTGGISDWLLPIFNSLFK